jgi:transposase InsO family protein
MFNKLPFGISSAPEHFQKKMQHILAGQDGTICHMDDVLICGCNQQEHDARLRTALQRIEAAGLTLNPQKCEFSKDSISFLGHIIDHNGISPDPRKTQAVQEMECPSTVSELRRFLGMVNQLGKFSAKLATLSQPLRELLSNKKAWLWGPAQDSAFNSIKSELANAPTLAPYSLLAPTTISADASAYGLGAVLLQQQPSSDHWKPVAFASRSLTETEKRYSQIEKEALALVWACERFSTYVIGKPIKLETDHKPLVPLLGKTNLDSLPPRVLRFRIRLMRFHYTISHVPGKSLNTADTLSRAPTSIPDNLQLLADQQTEMLVDNILSSLPANSDRLNEYRRAQQMDNTCQRIINFCQNGWPTKKHIPADLRSYWQVRSELTICNDLLLRGRRIVVPRDLQKETLDKVHSGHQGIQRCLLRITSSVWWPGIKQEMEQLVTNCPICAKTRSPPRQPMIASELPKYPWQKVATDFFQLNGTTYLLVADYFSRYLEVQTMTTTTAASTIRTLKAIFSRHGIPAQLISDNGPQFISEEMAAFAQEYNFAHVTSSPQYPQSNGFAERMVQTAKNLLAKSRDPYLALLSYRSTPLPWCGFSPSQLLMGRQLRSNLPQTEASFVPEWSYLPAFREKDRDRKDKQKLDYDSRHRVKEQPPLLPDETVWVRTRNATEPGRVIQPAQTPRSYVVQTPSGQLRRTQSHLSRRPSADTNPSHSSTDSHQIVTRSQSGASVRPPPRLMYWRKGDVVYT